MFFLLLGGLGAVLALGATGCAVNTNKEAEHPQAPPPPEDPPVEQPKPSFSESDNWVAYWTHKRLVEKGIAPASMDRGKFSAKYPGASCLASSGQFCVSGAGDGKLGAEEVLDFAFNDPLNYDVTLWEVLGQPLPYALDDYDKTTDFDDNLRGKVKDAIQFLDREIKNQGYAEDSPEYKERMTVGLYFLTAMPSIDRIKREQGTFDAMTKELETLGIGGLKQFLEEHGGLRITKKNDGLELSALEALKQGKANAPEHSKVLFAVLSMAHLHPNFIYVNAWKSDEPLLKSTAKENPNLNHVCVGVQIGDKMRLLDPRFATDAPKHNEYVVLSLRHFLAMDYMNRGMMSLAGNNPDQTRRLLETSRLLDGDSPFLQHGLGVISMLQGKPDDALKQFDRAVELYPNYAMGFFSRGTLKASKEDWGAAEKDFSLALQTAPDFAQAYLSRGGLRSEQNNLSGALQDFTKLIELSPADGYLNRGNTYARMNELGKALIDFNQAIEANPELGEAYGSRGLIYAQRKQAGKATADFKKFLKFAPSDRSLGITLSAMAPLVAETWKEPEKREEWETLAKEAGIDAVRADTLIKVAGMLWEVGQTDAAVKLIGNVANDLGAIMKKITAAKKPVPDSLKTFIDELRTSLPKAMRRDKKINEFFKKLG